jgi:hypothetical protein
VVFFTCGSLGMTVLARLMQTLRLSVVIVASALSLATASAMPDLGRETGKFFRNEQSAPKGARTFEPAELKDSNTGPESNLPASVIEHSPWLAITMPVRPPHVAITMPVRPPYVAITMPVRPPYVAITMPVRPPYVAITMPVRPPHYC